MAPNSFAYDYIIVGSGIAGLYTALLAHERGRVLILTKSSLDECNTKYAQGGIAAAVGPGDSPELHFQDTMSAGAGLSDPAAARILAREGPDRIADLARIGVPFDTVYGDLALTLEAAHSRARIIHAGGDATGKHIETTLSNAVRLSRRITVMEYTLATDILLEDGTACGVRALDLRQGVHRDFRGRSIILATGGGGRLFRYTTNPEVATGDGVSLALRAGARLADMEFFQFHPTALHIPGAPPFLISEAVRGEGGILRNIHGRPYMGEYSSEGDLAPRDVVARGTLSEMENTRADHVLLDVTHLPLRTVTTRFPQIYAFCRSYGLDMATTPIPVAPAAHYMMGGVKTDLWGQTSIPGLYACGETACTGVHGANRLASNSLLEVLVFAERIMEEGGREDTEMTEAAPPEVLHVMPEREGTAPPRLSLTALQSLMWEKAGMVRDGPGLTDAVETLAAWEHAMPEPQDRPTHELRNLIVTGRLLAEAALVREESRGAHFRRDFPDPSPAWRRRIILVKGR